MPESSLLSSLVLVGWFVVQLLKWLSVVFGIVVVLGGVVAVQQETKIWNPHPNLPNVTLYGQCKLFWLNVFWMVMCEIGAILVFFFCPKSQQRYYSHQVVEHYVAKMCTVIFIGPVVVKGREHLPKYGDGKTTTTELPAPVFVANHDSQIDVASVYHLNVAWRWIAKKSVVFLPGVGHCLWLGQHVFIDRVKKGGEHNKTGARNLYQQSNASVQAGVPMLFFPQGTRRLGQQLPFKDGAFKIALENESPLICISIEIPLCAVNSFHPFVPNKQPVILTVHPPIAVDKTKDTVEGLKQQCFDTIYSVLPDYTTPEMKAKNHAATTKANVTNTTDKKTD